MSGRRGIPTIASDEDMDWGYVLADEYAPTQLTAMAVLKYRAAVDWQMKLGTVEPADPPRRSYKWARDEYGEDNLVSCGQDDPERDSDWWVFDLSMNDHDLIDASAGRPSEGEKP